MRERAPGQHLDLECAKLVVCPARIISMAENLGVKVLRYLEHHFLSPALCVQERVRYCQPHIINPSSRTQPVRAAMQSTRRCPNHLAKFINNPQFISDGGFHEFA